MFLLVCSLLPDKLPSGQSHPSKCPTSPINLCLQQFQIKSESQQFILSFTGRSGILCRFFITKSPNLLFSQSPPHPVSLSSSGPCAGRIFVLLKNFCSGAYSLRILFATNISPFCGFLFLRLSSSSSLCLCISSSLSLSVSKSSNLPFSPSPILPLSSSSSLPLSHSYPGRNGMMQ